MTEREERAVAHLIAAMNAVKNSKRHPYSPAAMLCEMGLYMYRKVLNGKA